MDALTPNVIGLTTQDSDDVSDPLSDVNEQYSALRTGAMLVDRSARVRATFSGAAASGVLSGLVTNDVPSLIPGQGQYAALLTPKAKIIADVRIFVREEDVLVDTSARAADGFWATVRKYVNPRLAKYVDVSAGIRDIGLFGVGAPVLVSDVLRIDHNSLLSLAPYHHLVTELAGQMVMVARVPDAGLDGFELFAAPTVTDALRARAISRGAILSGHAAFDIIRIEAGRPEWGVEMDDSMFPQEANLEELHAISYTKGCYTGQETVARIHFRGHVNRNLRGARFDASAIPSPRAELMEASDGRIVGEMRSAVESPRLGGVGIALVRREVGMDTVLRANWAGQSTTVTVVGLPLPA
jgi:tRNA-modifying protein YgfZ